MNVGAASPEQSTNRTFQSLGRESNGVVSFKASKTFCLAESGSGCNLTLPLTHDAWPQGCGTFPGCSCHISNAPPFVKLLDSCICAKLPDSRSLQKLSSGNLSLWGHDSMKLDLAFSLAAGKWVKNGERGARTVLGLHPQPEAFKARLHGLQIFALALISACFLLVTGVILDRRQAVKQVHLSIHQLTSFRTNFKTNTSLASDEVPHPGTRGVAVLAQGHGAMKPLPGTLAGNRRGF